MWDESLNIFQDKYKYLLQYIRYEIQYPQIIDFPFLNYKFNTHDF